MVEMTKTKFMELKGRFGLGDDENEKAGKVIVPKLDKAEALRLF